MPAKSSTSWILFSMSDFENLSVLVYIQLGRRNDVSQNILALLLLMLLLQLIMYPCYAIIDVIIYDNIDAKTLLLVLTPITFQ